MDWRRYVVVGAVASSACAVEEPRKKPEAPDMTPLVTGYASPTRNFDDQTAREVQSLVEAKVKALIDLDALSDRIDAALASLNEDDAMAFAPGVRQNLVLQGEGFARITRICSGHGTPPPPVNRDVNGVLELTAGYSQDGIDPVVFGGATACLEQAGTARLTINGAVNLYVGENLKLAQIANSPVIFQLADFAFWVNGSEVVAGGFDFQVCRGTATPCIPGHFEILLGLAAGSTLVFFIDLANKTGGFRGANGVWRCDFPAGRCSDGAGGVVTAPGYQL